MVASGQEQCVCAQGFVEDFCEYHGMTLIGVQAVHCAGQLALRP